MKQNTSNDVSPDPVIDLPALLRLLWIDKWLVAGIAGLCVAGGATYAALATPIYKSEALLQVRSDARSPGLGGLAAQLSDLADLSALQFGGSQDRAVALATLKSRALIEPFIGDLNLLPILFPADWDSSTQRWKNADPEKRPSLWHGYNLLMGKVLTVREDRKTSLVTVSMEWSDPAEAQRWLKELVARTNAYLRARAIREGEGNLRYLEQQVSQTSQIGLRQSLFNLMEAEHKKLMLARADDEFALVTIDPPPLPRNSIRPRRTLLIASSLVLGALAGMLLVFARAAFRR